MRWRMRRRDLLWLAAGAAMTRNPASAETTTARVGFVQVGWRQDNQGLLDAFREALSALGWTDGGNIVVLDRWAEERAERLPGIFKELINSGVAVLVTGGTPATLAAKRASATIPIVMVGVDDPVAVGVVASLAQPPRQRHGSVSCFIRGDREPAAAAAGSWFPGCAGSRSSSGEIPASSKECKTSAPMPRR